MEEDTPYELILPRDLWERALRELLLHPDQIAVGVCRRNMHDTATELIVQTLEASAVLPRGDHRPPLGDWVVLGVPTGSPGDDVNVWVEHLGPRPTQLLVVGLLGLGPDRSSWDGAVVENGRIRPLDAVRIVGPGMVAARRQAAAGWADLTPQELERWSRTRGALGDETWRKVAGTSVLLFGAGRNGSALAFQLVALGVRAITIVDPDVVGIENLDASHCMTEADIGRPKVEALQERLVAFRSSCAITSIPHSVTHSSVVKKARSVDLIASCVDHDMPRLAAALLAHRFLKVHLDVGTGITRSEQGHVLAGDARLLLPRQGCVCCVGGLNNEDEARIELLATPGALAARRARPWHEQRAGSLVTLNGLTVSVAVQLWLDLLAGTLRSSHWHRLRWQAGAGVQADFASVDASSTCRICRDGQGDATGLPR